MMLARDGTGTSRPRRSLAATTEGSRTRIARDTVAGLEAHEITEAEALEQTGVEDIDEVYDRAAEEVAHGVEDEIAEAAAGAA